ncbi:MAG: hypothetical protein ABI729_09345 [Chitinophagales bacterium]
MSKKGIPSEQILKKIESLEKERKDARLSISAEWDGLEEMLKPVNLLKSTGLMLVQGFLRRGKKGLVQALLSKLLFRRSR